jgi:GT2 family glycosyltransferase
LSHQGPGLTPLTNVKAAAGGWEATGPAPWLRCDVPPSAGRWVRFVYSSGLADPLSRAALRFVGRRQIQDELLPAAMLGRAEWIGQLPEDVREIWVSPVLGPGRFSFRIDAWDIMSGARALTYFGSPGLGRAGKYVWGRLRRWDRFARLQARRALGATPLDQYETWRRLRARAFEADFDAPEPEATPLRFRIAPTDAAAAAALAGEFARQTSPFWSAGTDDLGDDDFVVPYRAGDRLEPHTLLALAAAIRREPDLDLLYADEDAFGPGQTRAAPRLKPDWSPLFSLSGYAGEPLALRGAAFKAGGFDAGKVRVAHVRRVLATRAKPTPIAPAPAPGPISAQRRATIVIPTRDRLDLLQPCVESLYRYAAGAEFELIVVDNGSGAADALAFLERLSREPERRVLRRPGPFNFSALCNAGAREARYPFLLFLNNDVQAQGPDWLGRMLEFAARPQVGAVGAKLLYPNGRLQHGGVVLGLDGFAGHVQRGVGADDPGYLGALAWPREVTAVTGACLAVEARKFFEVDGFNEAWLPVEYNDIDLCLRLSERGYLCVLEPRARLMHRESASRGANRWLDSRYASEHGYFRERWATRLRDDPYFHPALSLDALEIALG